MDLPVSFRLPWAWAKLRDWASVAGRGRLLLSGSVAHASFETAWLTSLGHWLMAEHANLNPILSSFDMSVSSTTKLQYLYVVYDARYASPAQVKRGSKGWVV